MKIQDALDLHLKEEASRIIGENISVPEYVHYTMVCSGTMVINGEHEFQSISE